MRSLAKTVFNH